MSGSNAGTPSPGVSSTDIQDPNAVGTTYSATEPDDGGSGKVGSVATSAGTGLMAAGGLLAATGVGVLPGAILAGVGAAVSIFGSIESASSQAQIAQEKAAADAQQAAEIISRQQANAAIKQQTAFRQELNISAEDAGAGHAGGAIGSQLEIQRQTDQQIALDSRDAHFQAQMVAEGGAITGQEGSQIQTAGYLNAGATLLGTAGKTYNQFQGPGPATALPGIPEGY